MKKLKVNKNVKKAQRIQPDRQVKKKRKLEKPKSFDIIGNFLYNYGMTGQNLAHDIFSYLDFPSIQNSHLVCKSWSVFLSNDKILWLNIMRQTQPFFEFLSNQFHPVSLQDFRYLFLTCSWHQKTKTRILQFTILKWCIKAREPFKSPC